MATVTKPPVTKASAARDPEIVGVYVWEWPVRIFHWIMVLSLVVLTVTGFYMHRPFIVATSSTAWVMGTMRFVHEIFGFVLMSVLLLRIYWFFAGNEWARWRAWVPLTKGQWASIRSMLLYYSYQRSGPEPEIGHNSLATSTYMVIVFLLALECLTGLVLFGVVSHSHFLRVTVGWIPHIVDIQYIRTTHYFIMFCFMAFVIHHVYSAVLVSMGQKNGLMESIFSGWKFVHRSLLEKKQAGTGVSHARARR
ncbi:MAG: Ni/Fe-hydrogenase, b-type cytochrome subunit [Silvibacterium sp.]|nr:Ni/Fe-hydrogenase, b-type cytochrome subunit [Silvibacterium sp.]